jgi:DNA-binding response OmpR family regulator
VPAESLRGSETILVVDDDSGVRKPMMRTLEACGYLVLEAHSGEHALTILDEHHGPVQLLVTDVVMPDMDGAKLAVMLREWYPRLSVLLLSGHGERAFDVVGIKRPAGTHFLAKPFKPSDLGRVVREILDAEWGIDAKRMGQDDTERIQAGDAQRRTEKRIGARRRAYRIAAECEFLQNELLRSEHRNWADAFGRVLMSARRLIALTPAGGEDMFDSELRPLPLLKEVQDEILAAVTALVSAVGASRDSPAARGDNLIRELAQQLF